MVTAGVMIGNRGCADAMCDTTRRYVDMSWELLTKILDALLLVLIGMLLLLVPFRVPPVIAAAVAVVVTLVVGLISVGLPVAALCQVFDLPPGSWRVLIWGWPRGGIQIAPVLALSLPVGPARDVVLMLTYGVVMVSILVQGLTIAGVVRRMKP